MTSAMEIKKEDSDDHRCQRVAWGVLNTTPKSNIHFLAKNTFFYQIYIPASKGVFLATVQDSERLLSYQNVQNRWFCTD